MVDAVEGLADARVVRVAAADGDQHHGVAVALAQLARQFMAVHAGHGHVQQHHVGAELFDQRQCALAAGGRLHLVAVQLERRGQHVGGVQLVVDHDHTDIGHGRRRFWRQG